MILVGGMVRRHIIDQSEDMMYKFVSFFMILLANCFANGVISQEMMNFKKDLVEKYIWMDTTLNSLNNTDEYKKFVSSSVDFLRGGGYDVIWIIDSIGLHNDSNSISVAVHRIGKFFMDSYIKADSTIIINIRFTNRANNIKLVYLNIPPLLFPKNLLRFASERNIDLKNVQGFDSFQKK